MTTIDPSGMPDPRPRDDDRTTDVLELEPVDAPAPDGASTAVLPADDPSTTDPAPDAERPRTRWAGIVWGLAFVAVAVGGIHLAITPAAFGAVVEWFAALTVPTLVATGLLAVGAVLLITGVAGLLRRLQRHMR